ncbi:T9SS type A sorting domain-containing protein [Dyadobacter flavalbus]|uniref:T9SS type A sorting domain-containing protein n=1 Tax=Dyadobacter flavalbus TaxID=2579942 RepID=A0A5M8QZY8_9BACT|nr:T9SS type A sorting domain-containing protein [Dyadobacter flavalbus]KAA6440256.1 T9SS type A sorting domain-containing protein [Dyadobacter flavalbus]
MKSVFFQRIPFAFALLAAMLMFSQAEAQPGAKDKKTSIRIKVSEDTDGKVRNVEKSYELGPMTPKEKDEFVEKVLDSLGVDKKKHQTVSITIDDGEGNKFASKKRNVIVDRRDEREPLAFSWKGNEGDNFDFNFNTETLRSHMRNFERDFNPKARMFLRDVESFGDRMGDVWDKETTKPASVRALNVYSNNPDNGVLNLRFSVPQKGDITISVTDTKGKEVGKKEIKDFEGEFVGQIDLRKNTKGTVFVSVVQNEDGAVKRVVIP